VVLPCREGVRTGSSEPLTSGRCGPAAPVTEDLGIASRWWSAICEGRPDLALSARAVSRFAAQNTPGEVARKRCRALGSTRQTPRSRGRSVSGTLGTREQGRTGPHPRPVPTGKGPCSGWARGWSPRASLGRAPGTPLPPLSARPQVRLPRLGRWAVGRRHGDGRGVLLCWWEERRGRDGSSLPFGGQLLGGVHGGARLRSLALQLAQGRHGGDELAEPVEQLEQLPGLGSLDDACISFLRRCAYAGWSPSPGRCSGAGRGRRGRRTWPRG
jgi:hypothetical protein